MSVLRRFQEPEVRAERMINASVGAHAARARDWADQAEAECLFLGDRAGGLKPVDERVRSQQRFSGPPQLREGGREASLQGLAIGCPSDTADRRTPNRYR